MKKNIFLSLSALFLCILGQAQQLTGFAAQEVELVREGDRLTVNMTLDVSQVRPYSNAAVVLIPTLYAADQAVTLKPIGVYSRGRYIALARAARQAEPFAADEYKYLSKNAPEVLKYTDSVPYEDWMDGAALRIDGQVQGCCDKVKVAEQGALLATYTEPEPEIIEFIPNYIYVQPDADVQAKERAISGEAFVIFKTGKTALDPEYLDNAAELEKIRATIDSVRNDNDITITRVMLRGYSSPDGKYANNEKFARERTEALKQYVSSLYPLSDDIWVTESVAENWEGLRAAVAASDALGSQQKILDVIDSDLAPDRKEAKLKSGFPKDYKYLLKEVFPTLRRTDYKVNYTIRSYTTAEEVREIMATRPWNLSIEEFFLAAQDYEPGTPEFSRVFMTAARMYPDDEVANINAANSCMSAGNLGAAARYIDRLGDSAVAVYTKGIYRALKEDWTGALELFRAAQAQGLTEAFEARTLTELIIEQRKTLNL
ncbi:MAG: DUF3868 domain-containing protein [Bacteroidales bacterium]|nr:DUF3868 domain-containing protein [Bacteroidales bacterium]